MPVQGKMSNSKEVQKDGLSCVEEQSVRNIVFVQGDIGTGKSTLIAALNYGSHSLESKSISKQIPFKNKDGLRRHKYNTKNVIDFK